MIYIVDTYFYIWFLDKSQKIKPLYHQILTEDREIIQFTLADLKKSSEKFWISKKYLVDHQRDMIFDTQP